MLRPNDMNWKEKLRVLFCKLSFQHDPRRIPYSQTRKDGKHWILIQCKNCGIVSEMPFREYMNTPRFVDHEMENKNLDLKEV